MKLLLIPLALLTLFGCGSHSNSSQRNLKLADSGSNPVVNVDTANHHLQTSSPKSTVPITPSIQPTTTTAADLPAIITSSSVKFDENFQPVATITLHNITGKEIDQILFRFTFTNHELKDGQIDYVTETDYSTFVKFNLQLHPPDTTTIVITVPQPKMKSFDTPNIFITKVRYFDGTIDSDDR